MNPTAISVKENVKLAIEGYNAEKLLLVPQLLKDRTITMNRLREIDIAIAALLGE